MQVLNYIKEILNFGHVIEQSPKQKTHRFIIQDAASLKLICHLFNGNMVLPTRNAKFLIFLAHYNLKAIKKDPLFKPIIPKYSTNLINLKNS